MAFQLRSQCSSQAGAGRRTSGFTLVEVAVALAIFVFGALAIIRIFPPALGVIQNSESRQIATMMGRSTLANMTAGGINGVPDAIFDTPPGGPPRPEPTPNEPSATDTSGQTKAITVVGGGTRDFSLPRPVQVSGVTYDANTETSFDNSALGRFKRIFGQRRVVQQSTAAGTPLFILTQFPYSNIASVRVHIEDRIVGVRVDDRGNLDFSDARRASNDKTFFDPAFPNRPPENDGAATSDIPNIRIQAGQDAATFYVSYRWLEGGRVQGVVDEPIRFPVNANWDTNFSGKVLNGGLRTGAAVTIPGTVQVRMRQPLAPPAGNNNPIRGYIEGLQLTPTVSGVSAGDIVSVDYDVADWRWLVDDGAPAESPTPTPGPTPAVATSTPLRSVRLSVRNITDDPSYAVYGLLMDVTSSDPRVPVTLLRSGQWDSTGATSPMFVPTDEKDRASLRRVGRVIYDTSAIAQPALPTQLGFRTRTVYRSLDGWAHQLSVAARTYQPFYSGPMPLPLEHPREQWGEYVLQVSGGQTYLYFHPSEVGKAIRVSYEYLDGSGNHRRIAGAVFTTQDDVIDAPASLSPVFVGAIGKVSRAELTDPQGNSVPVTAILSVYGIGMTARTAWIDRDRYTQQVVNGYRPMD